MVSKKSEIKIFYIIRLFFFMYQAKMFKNIMYLLFKKFRKSDVIGENMLPMSLPTVSPM